MLNLLRQLVVFWTSGKAAQAIEGGRDAQELQPLILQGVFWAKSSNPFVDLDVSDVCSEFDLYRVWLRNPKDPDTIQLHLPHSPASTTVLYTSHFTIFA